MTTKQVTVTKYISCDGNEFNTCQDCEEHERGTCDLLECQVRELLGKKRELRYAINEARIKARIARLDAEKLKPEARSSAGKSKYCKMMSEYWALVYWALVHVYNVKRRELNDVRRTMSMVIDNLYMWFGRHKKQSAIARLERRRRSDMWRREHTPDQWRTPIKIRVSKLPHPVRGEDVS